MMISQTGDLCPFLFIFHDMGFRIQRRFETTVKGNKNKTNSKIFRNNPIPIDPYQSLSIPILSTDPYRSPILHPYCCGSLSVYPWPVPSISPVISLACPIDIPSYLFPFPLSLIHPHIHSTYKYLCCEVFDFSSR